MKCRCGRPLGSGGSDRQRLPHPYRSHSTMGHGCARSVDGGSCGHRGTDLSSCREDGGGGGKLISQNVVWYVVKTCRERAGLEHFVPHDLRSYVCEAVHSRGASWSRFNSSWESASTRRTRRRKRARFGKLVRRPRKQLPFVTRVASSAGVRSNWDKTP